MILPSATLGMGPIHGRPLALLLASAGFDRAVRLRDVSTGRVMGTLAGHAGPVFLMAYAPDGRVLASAGGNASVRVWDVSTRTVRFTFDHLAGPAHSVAFAPDGRMLAASAGEQTLLFGMAARTEPRASGTPGPAADRPAETRSHVGTRRLSDPQRPRP